MDKSAIRTHVDRLWDDSVVGELVEYIRIPNKSVAFDRDWKAHGHMDRVVARFEDWARRQPIRGMKLEVVRLEGRTPLLFIEIPGDSKDCVLLYGHMDKQPEMSGWREGLGPWSPVIEGDRLYGRGSADDGYATFACLGAIGALQANSVPHARCVVVIEACEESGSFDLPHYIQHLAARIGQPSLCIALDSGCGNYDQLWLTTSLRGLVGGKLQVEVLTEGVHSGDAGGVVPDSFRIVRQLLSRVEDEATGKVLAPEFHAKIPEARLKQAAATAVVIGDDIEHEVSVHRSHAARQQRYDRADPQPRVAPCPVDHRRRRLAAHRQRRQRAAPGHVGEFVAETSADRRCARRVAETEKHSGKRSAVRMQGHLPGQLGRHRMGRARAVAVARAQSRRCFE